MTNNPLLASFQHAPALVNPAMKGVFEACLQQAALLSAKIEASFATDKPVMADDGFWFSQDDWRSAYRPYIVKNGVLLIPIKGVLLHDFGYQLGSWATGYTYIRRAFDRGMTDPEVKGIALVCDTPGGHVAGAFDLADAIYAGRGQKPIRGFASESAYSAGYLMISTADTVNVTRTGGVGSIGVVTMHVDYSKAMEQDGVKITFIHFGAHKVDGNPFEPLPDDVKARIQARIDESGELFVATVARNRGMSADDIRATEAACFTASEAVSNGLADNIGSLDDAVAAFAADLLIDDEEDDMSTNKGESAVDQAAVDTARAEGHAAGLEAGAVAERARFAGILGHENAKKRPKAAMSFATKTGMTIEQVGEMLADMPEEKAEAPAGDQTQRDSAFKQAMDSGNHPNVGADGGENRSEAQTDVEKDKARAANALTLAGYRSKKSA